VRPLKAWVKSCEIKGGGHEMAAMMLILKAAPLFYSLAVFERI